MDDKMESRGRKVDIPVWEKYMLSTEEASDYFHIGINKLRRIISLNPTAEWILWNGSHAYIKRRIFEQFRFHHGDGSPGGVLALFDVFPAVTQNLVVQLLNQVLTFLGLIGVIVDPTTAGLEDSDRAMGYSEPWEDDRE
ncbi:MAG: phage holin [Eubacterium sp.]|nr:phage holin [Eubacterium sp.]